MTRPRRSDRMPEGNQEYRIKQLEDTVKLLRERVHSMSTLITTNSLNITFLRNAQEKTADKEDVARIESGLESVRGIMLKAAIGITGSSILVAVSIIVSVVTG